MTKPIKSKRSNQKGAALFFALIFILILSVLGVSIMFVSSAESWSSLNYLEMTQARYGAEAGLNSAANYIVNTYCAPGNTSCSNGSSPAAGDTISLYNTNVSPVTLASNGAVVTLSTTSSAATYPVAAVESAFQSAAAGSLTSGTRTINYTATATLVAMNSVTTAAGTQTVQTWNVTAGGSMSGIRAAQVQVTGNVEQQVTYGAVSAPSYGVFALGTGCDAINLSGNPLITSYSSAKPLVSGSVQLNSFGGNVGTNGNLTAAGSSTVEGTLSTPRTGVLTGKKAACSSAAVNAGDYTGTSTVTGCSTAGPVSPATSCTSTPVQLSQNITYSTPTMPGSAPTFSSGTGITIGYGTTCANINISTGCSGSGGNLTLTPPVTLLNACGSGCNLTGQTSLPALTVNSTGLLTINPGGGTITFNGITQSNGGQITINATSPMTVNTTSLTTSGSQSLIINNSAAVTLNAWGNSSGTGVSLGSGTALSMSGSSVVTLNIASTATAPFTASGAWSNTNSTGVPTPAMFQINYGGTSTINVEAGSAAAAAIYAPNAPVDIVGGATFYGSIIGTTVTDTNGANIYYDTQMGSPSGGTAIATVQQFMMDSFSWSRF
jgi:fibronectin-binding autotransporter adhesin